MKRNTEASIISAGEVGNTDGYTAITDIRQINFNDTAAVEAEINNFAEAYANSNVENALVITPAGKVYSLRGNEVTVNPEIINLNELTGSIVIHNHPMPEADSFSRFDFTFFFDHALLREDVIFGNSHHTMQYNGVSITANAAGNIYRTAFNNVRQRAMKSSVHINNEQLATMRYLSRNMKGLTFNENIRKGNESTV